MILVVELQWLHIDPFLEGVKRSEWKLAEEALATGKVAWRVGRPRRRLSELVADKGYHNSALRKRLRARGIRPTSPAGGMPSSLESNSG